MTYQVLQGWALVALAITGPPSAAYALSKFWFWGGIGEAFKDRDD